MRKFDKVQFQNQIKNQFGSVKKLKHFLEFEAKDVGFDVRLSEVDIDGVKVKMSGNPNHFAKFFVQIQHVGMTGTYALDYDSFTREGKRRGATYTKTIL